MNILSKQLLISLILILSGSLWAQNDVEVINDHYFNTDIYTKKFANRKITTKLEKDKDAPFIANLFMEAVYIYKDYISPQDMDVCTFHPSCSEYAFLCLKHQSFPEAILNTGDRLMRCYSANYIYYKRDEVTGLSEDYPDTTK